VDDDTNGGGNERVEVHTARSMEAAEDMDEGFECLGDGDSEEYDNDELGVVGKIDMCAHSFGSGWKIW
jgi:hypothetical protein